MLKNFLKTAGFLHLVLLFYSLTSVISKLTSGEDFLSMKMIVLYGIMMFMLVIYAFLWQKVLKRVHLTVAFANKAVVIIWGFIWGMVFFHEVISWNMIAGAAVIILGIIFVSRDEGKKEETEK